MKSVQIFSGSSNVPLAKKLGRLIGAKLATVHISRFANDEARVHVESPSVPQSAIVVQSLSKPVDEHIIEFCFISDAVHRLGVADITAVIPWMGYSKQDKVFRSGEPLSVKVVAKILQVVPIRRIYTFDLHNLAILGFFEVPLTNLSARPLFTEYFRKKITDKTVVVAPDAGAIKISTSFAMELNIPVAYMDKKRDLSTGKVTVTGISRNVDSADIIIIDDMIVTGDTLIETAKYLRGQNVRSITVGATHHLWVPGVQNRLEESDIDKIVVTDTIVPETVTPKLEVLSVAEIVAREFTRGR